MQINALLVALLGASLFLGPQVALSASVGTAPLVARAETPLAQPPVREFVRRSYTPHEYTHHKRSGLVKLSSRCRKGRGKGKGRGRGGAGGGGHNTSTGTGQGPPPSSASTDAPAQEPTQSPTTDETTPTSTEQSSEASTPSPSSTEEATSSVTQSAAPSPSESTGGGGSGGGGGGEYSGRGTYYATGLGGESLHNEGLFDDRPRSRLASVPPIFLSRFPARLCYHDLPPPTACGTTNNDSEAIVAIGAELYDSYGTSNSMSQCGKSLTITWNGKTAKATARDRCPGCAGGSLDMSPTLFQQFAPLEKGVLDGIQWSWD